MREGREGEGEEGYILSGLKSAEEAVLKACFLPVSSFFFSGTESVSERERKR
jgi:hypothetical protein